LKKFILLLLSFFIGFNIPVYAQKTLNGAGATFPFPVYQSWAYQYYKDKKFKVNYQSIGSGGGIRQITSRTVDFGASDDPMRPVDVEKEKLIQFPVIIGGVVPVLNLPEVKSGELVLTGEVLGDIFLGKIKKWNNKAITDLNKGLKLPDAEITVVHRADGSGTTAIFSGYLSAVNENWKSKVGTGKALNWPVGFGGKGNEGVANFVNRMDNSIGYVEFAYVKQSKMKYAKLINKAGKIVDPSIETFKAAADGVNWEAEKHFYNFIINASGDNAWPIAGASFILLARENTETNKRVIDFFDWAFKNGDNLAQQLEYVPLTNNLKQTVRGYWSSYHIFDNK
jgi:phosphate transport system substrate-binding protein